MPVYVKPGQPEVAFAPNVEKHGKLWFYLVILNAIPVLTVYNAKYKKEHLYDEV